MHKSEIIESYARLRGPLHDAADILKDRLVAALQLSGVKVHDVSQRVKSEASLKSKISRPDKIYEHIAQITDLIGLRVVTYFEDGVEEVARIVEERFVVDFERSIDKRVQIDPSSFGYRSLHYVCQPSPESLQLPFEIQIRTVLQHAWAEIEHDLGYKFPEAVPSDIKRRFSRVAGLLEIADAEFVELRKSMQAYETKVKQFQPTHSDALDVVLLRSIIDTQEVSETDQMLGAHLQKPIANLVFFPDYLIRLLHRVKLHDSVAILGLLALRRKALLSFMERYFKFTEETWGFAGTDFDSLQKGYSLFLLAHWRALEEARTHAQPLDMLQNFYGQLDYPQNAGEAARVAALFYRFFADWEPLEV